jgi:hypothetical protein
MACLLLEQLPQMGVNALIAHRVLKLMAESGESVHACKWVDVSVYDCVAWLAVLKDSLHVALDCCSQPAVARLSRHQEAPQAVAACIRGWSY